MGEHSITVGDGTTVALRRIGPDAWEVVCDGAAGVVVERATAWGWTVTSPGFDDPRPWMSVREAFLATHADLAQSEWAQAVAEWFDRAPGAPRL